MTDLKLIVYMISLIKYIRKRGAEKRKGLKYELKLDLLGDAEKSPERKKFETRTVKKAHRRSISVTQNQRIGVFLFSNFSSACLASSVAQMYKTKNNRFGAVK